jgi:hypothetical protein
MKCDYYDVQMRGELKAAPFLFLSLDNYLSTFAENI